MHYYKKEIAKYHNRAGRLTMLQHGAYNLLIDACYDREEWPTREEAIDWLWASSKEEIEAIDFVLSKFFKLTDDRYSQSHIEEDIAKFHANSATNKRIALEREAKKREESTKREQTVNESPPNKELGIKNKELETIKDKPVKKSSRFTPPTLQEVSDYCNERGNTINPQKFIDHYEAIGWLRGKNKIKSWKACVRTWEGNQNGQSGQVSQPSNGRSRKPTLLESEGINRLDLAEDRRQ